MFTESVTKLKVFIMLHFIFYQGDDNWYMRLVHIADGTVWDHDANALGAATTWSNSAIALVFDGVIGGHRIELPNKLPAGDYDVLFYDAASPLVTDELQVGKRLLWNGKSLSRHPTNL